MQNKLTLPVAIVLAGAIIAGAVIYTQKPAPAPTKEKVEVVSNIAPLKLSPITAEDHILGNPDPSVAIVEFSDTECPFCKTFHATLLRIMDDYGKTGKLAWIYRHYPIPQLHPKAPKEAEATECAAEQGKNQKFWEYLTEIFKQTPSNNGLDADQLPVIAGKIGLNVKNFNTCLASGKFASKVDAQAVEAAEAGGEGTPYSIFVLKNTPSKKVTDYITSVNSQAGSIIFTISEDSKRIGMSGALPYDLVKEFTGVLVNQ